MTRGGEMLLVRCVVGPQGAEGSWFRPKGCRGGSRWKLLPLGFLCEMEGVGPVAGFVR